MSGIVDPEAVKLADLEFAATRGGRRQREQALKEIQRLKHGSELDVKMEKFDSLTAHSLVKEWSIGRISAVRVQKCASDAWTDIKAVLRKKNLSEDLGPKSLKALAGLGKNGQYKGNINAELKTWLGESDFPPPHTESIWMKVCKPRKHTRPVQKVLFPIVLPHILFAFLFASHPAAFHELFIGDMDSENPVGMFWDYVFKSKDPRLDNHPLKDRPGWQTRALPLSIHGDAVPCVGIGKAGTSSFDAYSWQGILAKKASTMRVKQFIFGIFEKCKCKFSEDGVDTMDSIFHVVVWSLWFLYLGIWPTCDAWGKPWQAHQLSELALAGTQLAGGYFGVLWIIKGDLDHLAKNLHLPHYGSAEPCALCPARSTGDEEMSFTNFRKNAAWKTMLYNANIWRLLNTNPHQLFAMVFLSCLNVEPDELHVVHLGTSMYFLGSVLFCLCFRVLRGNPVANMARVWQMITEAYKECQTSCQFSCLTLHMFCDPLKPKGHYPKLEGRGAEVKGLVKALRQVWVQLMDHSQEYHVSVLSCFDAQIEIQSLLDDCKDLFLTPAEVRRLRDLVDEFLLSYTKLSNAAFAENELLWNLVPKFHWYWHLIYRAQYLHPRKGNTFIDEDFVGILKVIVKACVSGIQPHNVPALVIEKMRWSMHIDTIAPPYSVVEGGVVFDEM